MGSAHSEATRGQPGKRPRTPDQHKKTDPRNHRVKAKLDLSLEEVAVSSTRSDVGVVEAQETRQLGSHAVLSTTRKRWPVGVEGVTHGGRTNRGHPLSEDTPASCRLCPSPGGRAVISTQHFPALAVLGSPQVTSRMTDSKIHHLKEKKKRRRRKRHLEVQENPEVKSCPAQQRKPPGLQTLWKFHAKTFLILSISARASRLGELRPRRL